MSAAEMIGKPLTAAIVGGVATKFMFPSLKNFYIMGKEFPLPVVAGAAVGLSSVIAETAHNYIYPKIPVNEKLEQPISAIIAAGLNAASLAGVMYLLNPNAVSQLGLVKIAAFGAGVDVAPLVGVDTKR